MDEEDTVMLGNREDIRLIQPEIEILRTANFSSTDGTSTPINLITVSTSKFLQYYTPAIKVNVLTMALFFLEFITVCCSFIIIIRSSQEAVRALHGRGGSFNVRSSQEARRASQSDNVHYTKNEFKFLKSFMVVILFAHSIQMVLGVVCFFAVTHHEKELIQKYLYWSAFYFVLRSCFLGLQVYNYMIKGYKHMSGIMFFISFIFITWYLIFSGILYLHYKDLKIRGKSVFEPYLFCFLFFNPKKMADFDMK